MAVTKVCCTCLSYDVEMFSLTDDDIRKCLEQVNNITIRLEHDFMQNVCGECVLLMRTLVKFKNTSLQAKQTLKRIMTQSIVVTKELINTERMKLYSNTTINFHDHLIFADKISVKIEENSHEIDIKPNLLQESENDAYILGDTLSEPGNSQFVETKTCEIEISDIFSANSEFNGYNEFSSETLNTGVKNEVLKSPKKKITIKSTENNEVVVGKEVPVWKSDYATGIISTEKEEFLENTCSKSCSNAPTECPGRVTGSIPTKTFEKQIRLQNDKNHRSVDKRDIPIKENIFSCDICLKKFTFKQNLQTHILIHTGEKPFSCDVCQRKFKRNSALKIHQNQHTGKLTPCDLCDQKFSCKYSLNLHKRKHTGERPFACDICDMRFTQLTNMKRHQLVHTGVKAFACELCGKTFTQVGSLHLHIKTVHLKLPHPPRKPRKKKLK